MFLLLSPCFIKLFLIGESYMSTPSVRTDVYVYPVYIIYAIQLY